MKIQVKQSDQGRYALVTGASSGIGRQIAEVLAQHGFRLVITARRRDRLLAIAEGLRSAYGAAVVVIDSDLSAPEGPAALMREIVDQGIDVDILVNCAGTDEPSPYETATWEFHRRSAQLMALSPAELIHLTVGGMLDRGYGRVLNMTSVAAFMPGTPMHGFYSPAKSFLYKLTETLAAEYYDKGVTFTAVAPGVTESEMIDSSGARSMVDKLPSFMVADARSVAEESVAACLGGVTIYTHSWFNRLYFGIVLRHFPTRYAHRLMRSERDRALKQIAGDAADDGLPGLARIRRTKA